MADFLTHLDLFSGIGGFALAAQKCGFTTVGFCEIDPYAQQILIEKFGAVLADAKIVQNHRTRQTGFQPFVAQCSARLHPDIFTLDGAEYLGVDLVTGGFPCQPFSCAGKRRGKEDDRHLWPEMLRVIAEARPRFIVGENVPGIIGMELDNCLSDLEAIGYACRPIVVPACAVDARHRRDRVWIMGYSTSHGFKGYGREHGLRQGGSQMQTCGTGQVVANSEHSERRTEHKEHGESYRGNGFGGSGETLADSKCDDDWRANGAWRGKREQEKVEGNGMRKDGYWLPEPNVGRVANGVPARTHRLRALGNAIVPQVAVQILKALTHGSEKT